MVTGSRGKRSVTRCIGVRFIRPLEFYWTGPVQRDRKNEREREA
uniref:Uncharacterized protein n=1 Tax=Anguilla anguilla TaxID=7936 RepID=A0A0E9TMI4_ANGAN